MNSERPAKDFVVKTPAASIATLGYQRIVLGGSPSDDVVVPGWPESLVVLERTDQGWTVWHDGSYDLRVNGEPKIHWLVGSTQQLTLGDVSVWLDPTPVNGATIARPQRQPPAFSPDRVVVTESSRSSSDEITVGSAPDNVICIDDPRVGSHHLILRDGPEPTIEDLGARSGTYIDGRRIHGKVPIEAQQIVAVASQRFVVAGTPGRLVLEPAPPAHPLEAVDVKVERNGTTILRSTNFTIKSGELVAILGPSGSGKSTLIKSLAGMVAPTSGTILISGENLYGTDPTLRQQIGYVPQDDILHTNLPLVYALAFSADLRFLDSTSFAIRKERVLQVLAALGLAEHKDKRIADLSGGQRKRVNVATELLTTPRLLLLDEPTSGLDPGYEKEVMRLLRALADEGAALVVITHSLQSLQLCDKLLILAAGGNLAYFGPPEQALEYFDVSDLAEIFIRLERGDVDWHESWRRHHGANAATPRQLEARDSTVQPARQRYRSVSAQFLTLSRRSAEVLVRDRRQLLIAALQGPIIALLMVAVMGSGQLSLNTQGPSRAVQVVLALILGAVYIGGSTAIREVVKERAILQRERHAGIGFGPYLLSKVAVLGVFVVVQSVVLVGLGLVRQDGLSDPLVFSDARLEVVLAVTLTGLASLALALAISSAVQQEEKAMLILPIVMFAQFLLTGASFELGILEPLSFLMPARWGFSAAAATADLPSLTGGCPDRSSGCPGLWDHAASSWLSSMSVLVVLTTAYLGTAAYALVYREDRGQL